MTPRVHTARVSYGGADRLDITRKSAPPEGIAFAPSWAILRPALDALTLARTLRDGSTALTPQGADAAIYADGAAVARRIADAVTASTWDLYRAAYTLEMRESYRRSRPAWDAILARESVTLVCYCTDPTRCHRTVLAGILAKLGAINEGERHG